MAKVEALTLSTGRTWQDVEEHEEPPRLIRLTEVPEAVVGVGPIPRGRLYSKFGKRTLDIALVLLLSPLWLPLYAVAALCILVLDGRPIHYSTTRTGRGCAPYRIYKLRTMRKDADAALHELLSSDVAAKAEYLLYNKLKDDPRISRVGRFLRRSSLDELPQLFNVLKGDMSIVGPRPPSTESDTYSYYGALARYVFDDRPGLTGLWQVSPDRHKMPYERKIWQDLTYARRCSFLLDIKIIAKTIPTVLSGRGAF